MVSESGHRVLLYLRPLAPQAPSKKAGKKVTAAPKKGGAQAKVAKVRALAGSLTRNFTHDGTR